MNTSCNSALVVVTLWISCCTFKTCFWCSKTLSHLLLLFQEPAAMRQLRQQGGKLSRQGQAWQPNPTLDALKPRPNDLVLLHMPALPDSHQYMPGLSPSSTETITIRSQGGNTYMRTALSVFILRQVCWWWWWLWWWLRIWQGCYQRRALSLLVCNILEDISSLCWMSRYCLCGLPISRFWSDPLLPSWRNVKLS